MKCHHSTITHHNYKTAFGPPLLALPLLLVLAIVMLSSCARLEGVSRVEIGMVESAGLKKTEARFETLSGRKTQRETLDEGDTLSLGYEVALEKGVLTLQIVDPASKLIWERVLDTEARVSDETEFVAAETGTYTIVVIGAGAGGSYQLQWKITR